MNLALIPARGGSKGIKKKNLALINNKPLIAYTIEAAINSDIFSSIVVSSDDDEILDYAKQFNVQILKRPQELSTDNAKSSDVVLHSLEYFACTNVALLQPTSPLRTTQHIKEAFKEYNAKNAQALISVTDTDNKILKAFVENKNGFLEGIRNNQMPFTARQALPKTYLSNGAIYIVNADLFKQNKGFLQKKTIKYIMDEISSIDIDTVQDLNIVENILKNYDKKSGFIYKIK